MNDREAARWLRAAAEQGWPDALVRLAGYQAAGRGGRAPSPTAAAESYYRAGLTYLQQDRTNLAARCVEALRLLQKEGGLPPSHADLDERLLAATHPRRE